MAKQAQPPKSAASRNMVAKPEGTRSGASGPKGSAQRNNRRGRRRSNNMILLWVIAGVVVLIAGVLLLNQRSLTNNGVTSAPRVSEGTTWGPADAPVKIVEYSNFGCIHCKNFAQNDEPQLRKDFESTGKVRFEFKQFKLGDPSATDAANASLCAADQQRFWDMHDLLFQKQGLSASVFSKASLKSYGQQLGLDAAKFNACVDNSQFMSAVDQNSQDGVNLGVNGTPTFFINGKMQVGEMPYATLKSQIDALVKSAS